MRTFTVGQAIMVSAQAATVLEIGAEKRGRVLLTVKMADGSTRKVDTRGVDPAIEFAAPISAAEFFRPLPSSAQALRSKINRY